MINIFLLISFSVFASTSFDGAQGRCRQLFTGQHNNQRSSLPSRATTQTLDVINYLSELLTRGEITFAELKKLSDDLSHNQVRSPFAIATSSTNAAKHIVAGTLVRLLKQEFVNPIEINNWILQTLERAHVQTLEKKEVSEKAKLATHPIELFAIYPYNFSHRTYRKPGLTHHKLSRPFLAMSTLVTQYHWVDVMGANPSRLDSGQTSNLMEHRNIALQADLPVTNMTWWSAIVFANELSRKHNLEPAYDLHGLVFDDRKRDLKAPNDLVANSEDWNQILEIAARGDLVLTRSLGNPLSQNNDTFKEGYRLITFAEYQFLLKQTEIFEHFSALSSHDEAYLSRFAWTKYNQRNGIQPVATLSPSLISNRLFYDILGNAEIWTEDPDDSADDEIDAEKPRDRISSNPLKLTAGASVVTNTLRIRLGQSEGIFTQAKSPYRGIRLVRTINLRQEGPTE